jgi:hypothetical protein
MNTRTILLVDDFEDGLYMAIERILATNRRRDSKAPAVNGPTILRTEFAR